MRFLPMRADYRRISCPREGAGRDSAPGGRRLTVHTEISSLRSDISEPPSAEINAYLSSLETALNALFKEYEVADTMPSVSMVREDFNNRLAGEKIRPDGSIGMKNLFHRERTTRCYASALRKDINPCRAQDVRGYRPFQRT